MTEQFTGTGSTERANDGGSGSGGRLTAGLGWASIALGVPLVARPGAVCRLIGVGDGPKQRAITTGVGTRELLAAGALLYPKLSGRWMWARVAGDAVDLALLGWALAGHGRKSLSRTVSATVAVGGITAVDVYAAIRELRASRKGTTTTLTGTTTIGKDPQEVYAFWRELENLPEFMTHVEDVRGDGSGRTHWRVTAPFGKTVEWDAAITQDVPGQLLAWRSVDGSAVTNAGHVRFSPAPKAQGTEVHVTISYEVPGGKLGAALARWSGEEPHQQLDDDLRRFKQVMETGEVVRSDGAPGGKRARKEFPQHAARPLADDETIDLTRTEVRA